MIEPLFLLLFFVLVPALLVAGILWDTARRAAVDRAHHEVEIARLEALHEGERKRLVGRVQYLEFQLANHVAHVLHLPSPAPPIDNGQKPEPLPEVMLKFLEAVEDDEARAEFEQGFRAELALGIDAHQIVSRALSNAG